jgi:hypothetical protein
MSPAFQQRREPRPEALRPVTPPFATPQILRVDRFILKPGTEVAVTNLHRELALASTRWGYPQPFLTVESLTGPSEIWRLTGYQSPAEQKRAAQSLETNLIVRLARERIEDQLRVLVGSPVTVIANFSGDRRASHPWLMGRGHYLVIGPAGSPVDSRGADYETSAGVRYWIASARTRSSAYQRAAEAVPGAAVFAIRPACSMPSVEWTRRDPGFWNSSPVAKCTEVTRTAFGPR